MSSKFHSCDACQSRLQFTIGNYYSDKGWYELIEENYWATGEAYAFNISFREAIEQAKLGCEFFEWLVTLKHDDTTPDSFLRSYWVHNSHEQIVLDWVNQLDDHISDHISGGSLERKMVLVAEESEIASLEIVCRLPNMLPSSDQTTLKAKAWLDDCISSHAECQNLQSVALPNAKGTLKGPRRMVELFGSITNPRARLIETYSGSSPQYIALSYCWGGDQTVKLKNALVKQWLQEIPCANLQQTIKDAMQVVRSLGFRHLWVDALCIIQDSDSDKAQEITRMANIYEDAHLTISAAKAEKALDGFLQSRYIPGERGFRMPFTCDDGRESSIILWKGRQLDSWEPIDKRAWCFQESLLSNRVLEYATHTVRWRCAHNKNEKSPTQFDGWIARSQTFAQHGLDHVLAVGVDWSGLGNPQTFVDTWTNLVVHYSRRGIGFQSDKLLAISAIARKMSKASGRRYMAGLWEEDIANFLMWYPNTRPSNTKKPVRTTTAIAYVAPSWSWASFEGEIDFNSPYNNWVAVKVEDIKMECQIPGDEFSSVKSATLKINVPTFRSSVQILQWGGPQLREEKGGGSLNVGLMFDLREGDWHLDFKEGDELVLALIMSNEGLILKPTTEVNTYRRIGRFQQTMSMNEPNWVHASIILV